MSKNVLEIFSKNDIDGISALIAQLEKSPFDYLKLESEDVRIVIGKNGVTEAAEASTPISQVQAQASAAAGGTPPEPATQWHKAANEAVESNASVAIEAPQEAVTPGAASSVTEEPGTVIVKSPSYGMFYAQSDPSSPPYISVGSVVKKGDTLGLLEIMKTYSAITSDTDGVVVGIFVKNEDILEPDQPLFSIRVD